MKIIIEGRNNEFVEVLNGEDIKKLTDLLHQIAGLFGKDEIDIKVEFY